MKRAGMKARSFCGRFGIIGNPAVVEYDATLCEGYRKLEAEKFGKSTTGSSERSASLIKAFTKIGGKWHRGRG